jgi:hypothetical protein
MILVCVDTTAVDENPRLDGGGWPELLAWSRGGLIEVVVAEVTMLEADRHLTLRALARVEAFGNSAKALPAVEGVAGLDLEAIRRDVLRDTDRERERRRQLLVDSRATVLPLPDVSHESLLARDLSGRKPFRASGKGYRDALIWESLLEHLRAISSPMEMVFVTNDNDFGGHAKDGSILDSDLLDEIQNAGHSARRAVSISALVDQLREEYSAQADALDALLEIANEGPSLRDRVADAVIAAAKSWEGEPLEDPEYDRMYGGGGFESLLPDGFTGATVQAVEVDRASVDIDVYDDSNDTLLMHVDAEASVDLDGFVDKSDLYLRFEDAEVLDSDWNDHTAWLALTRRAALRFYVTVVGASIEEVQLDVVDPII